MTHPSLLAASHRLVRRVVATDSPAADALEDARRVAIQAGDAIGRMRADDAARHGLVIPHAHIIGIINRDYTGDETT